MSTPAPVNLEILRSLFKLLTTAIPYKVKMELLTGLNPMVTPVNVEYYLDGQDIDTMLVETMVLVFLSQNKVGA